jgi:hypothetical protein
MPLQPVYTWSETESSVCICVDNVPIKDASQLFCADRVIKLNAPPYLLLLDLRHAVDEDRSSASITRGRKVVITLAKVGWPGSTARQAAFPPDLVIWKLPASAANTATCTAQHRPRRGCGTS